MHARITTGQGEVSRIDEAIQRINDVVIPRAKELPGMITGYWLADRSRGKVMGVVLFDSEEHLRASSEAAAQLRQQTAEAMGVTFQVDEYEVVGQT